MKPKVVYQTIKRKGTIDSIQQNGPIYCNSEYAWLGYGYYFWDTFIENSHWWGNHKKYRESGYIICEAHCDYNEIDCFDLTEGCVENLLFLEKCLQLFGTIKGVSEDTLFSKILDYLMEEKIIKCSAIRIVGENIKKYIGKTTILLATREFDLTGKLKRPKYLELKPPIQICLFKKECMNLRNYKIVYPPEYLEGYLM